MIRESGGDRSGVTGGTRVLSDRIVVEITASAGQSFLDRMIALVEGAIRQRTPNEIALCIVLAAFTLIFLIVTATLWPIAYNAELYMQPFNGDDKPIHSLGTDVPTLVALLVCLIPDNDRRTVGRNRHRRHGPGTAGEHYRQERQGGRSGGRRRYASVGQDRHDHHRQSPRHAVCALRRHERRRVGPACRAGLRGRRNARRQEHRRFALQAERRGRRQAGLAGRRRPTRLGSYLSRPKLA